MVISEKIYTIEEYEGYATEHPGLLFELIDGRIVEKVTSEEHGKIVINIGSELRTWQRRTGQQGHYSTESSYRLPEGRQNERRPDVSFRYTEEGVSSATAIYAMPDFAVEIKPSANSYDELREKAHFYIGNGSRLIWLVYPAPRIVEVYFADGSSELFKEDDTLSGGEILPGFEMVVKDIFDL